MQPSTLAPLGVRRIWVCYFAGAGDCAGLGGPMSVKRWDAEHEHVNETGEFVLATDYDELRKKAHELIDGLGCEHPDDGEGCGICRAQSEWRQFDASH